MADEIGIHDDGVLTAVRGTIFMAKAETIITSALLKQFTVEAATVGVGDGMWTNLGHMSNDNLPEFALDGGDATTLSTWLKAAFRTQYAQTTGTVTFNSVQGDKGTFKTFYNAVDMTGAGVAFSLEKTPHQQVPVHPVVRHEHDRPCRPAAAELGHRVLQSACSFHGFVRGVLRSGEHQDIQRASA